MEKSRFREVESCAQGHVSNVRKKSMISFKAQAFSPKTYSTLCFYKINTKRRIDTWFNIVHSFYAQFNIRLPLFDGSIGASI